MMITIDKWDEILKYDAILLDEGTSITVLLELIFSAPISDLHHILDFTLSAKIFLYVYYDFLSISISLLCLYSQLKKVIADGLTKAGSVSSEITDICLSGGDKIMNIRNYPFFPFPFSSSTLNQFHLINLNLMIFLVQVLLLFLVSRQL